MRRRKAKPFFERLEVIDAGAKGKAIARAPDGRVVLLGNAVPGDIVDVQTTRKRKAYYEGFATEFHRLSDKRATPKCEHFGMCGGCKWQHLDYQQQLFYKQKEVLNNFKRIGHLDFPEPDPMLGCEEQYYYRNKLEFTFSDNRWLSPEEISSGIEIADRNALGFHIPGMWDKILDINSCHLQREPSNDIRLAIKKYAIEQHLAFFNLKKQQGFIRTLMIRTSRTGDLMVLLQFFEDDKEKREGLLNFLKDSFPEISSLLYTINRKGNDTLYDLEIHCYSGKNYITEEMEELQFKITAKSFYQTNSKQAYELYKVVREYAGLKGDEIVYDFYTGAGTIAQFIASRAAKVIGVDSVEEAILSAKENATMNAIENTEFLAGDMKLLFNSAFVDRYGKPDVVITDPPRDGMHKDVVMQLLDISPPRVVYVSCNSATQARDLDLMKERYEIKRIQTVDMFPQTHHVENVVLLEGRDMLRNNR